MTLQGFADRISELVWGGERGWVDEDGLQRLADTVRFRLAHQLANDHLRKYPRRDFAKQGISAEEFSDLEPLRPALSETFERDCSSRSFMPLVLCAHCGAPLDGNGKCLALNEKKVT